MTANEISIDESDVRLVGPFRVEYTAAAESRLDEYRLRYSVFVEERHFRSADACADRQERDEFDDASCAFVLRDARTGESAACQRFILPERLAPGIVTNVERVIDRRSVDVRTLPYASWAEVSRSTIAPKYRWGSAATTLPALVAIKYASVALAVALGRRTLFTFSDPRTARLSRRLGLTLRQVGDAIEFHGLRAPFSIDVSEVLRSVPDGMSVRLHQLIAQAGDALAAAHF